MQTGALAAAGITTTPEGTPSWQPVDLHLFSAPIGTQATGFDGLFATIASILPPPNHLVDPISGIRPGAPHPPPYDDEIGNGIRRAGFVGKTNFTGQEFSNGSGIYLAFMMVPRPGSASGSSPDFASGPILPNSLFPIRSLASTLRDGELFSSTSEFDTQPLSGFDGYSHTPDFYVDNLDFALSSNPVAQGSYQYQILLNDAAGNGWRISAPFAITSNPVPEPATFLLLGIGLAGCYCICRHADPFASYGKQELKEPTQP